MRQGYLTVRPTVRIREEVENGREPVYILCFKSAGTIARKEIEISVEKEIFDQLNADGASILMITHEQAVADRAHRVYHLLDGRLEI